MLMKLVLGELDWIVMNAQEKDRSKRYQSANGFAMDVHRFLTAAGPCRAAGSPGCCEFRPGARGKRCGSAAVPRIIFWTGTASRCGGSMTESRPDNEAIFHAAWHLPDPERRRAYVWEACGGDEARIAHVEALLAAAACPESLLDRLAAATALAAIGQSATESAGTVIGPYKLVEQIGEGGMGSVWMAQQKEPVTRLVAVKLIKAGMDSRQVIARFEAERHALALMDHPNIARVLDGGTADSNPKFEAPNPKFEAPNPKFEAPNPKFEAPNPKFESRNSNEEGATYCPLDFEFGASNFGFGRPYFVMDLVKGVPITRYCDEHHLTPRQRLELFIPVCQAVQHAHQKGVIHRDLKPSNVLVALYDGKPVPKIIDFGVAKATGQQLTDKTLVTGFGAIVGTPEYMSPEQAEFNQLDIDTRSDIYSLGVLLYELLAGSPPFSRNELTQAGMVEMLRVIREQEPSKPSTKLTTAVALPALAANRGMEPARLTKLVRGELDWIVMKALEKDRNRRYETANGFAMDVQRYLADEPVVACPPSAAYRLRKFARRNRGALAVAALILFFLVLLGSGAGWVVRDRSAREAKAARQLEGRQAKVAGQVVSIFAEVDRLEKEQKWAEALEAARRAEAAVAGGEADPATATRVHQRLTELEFVDQLEGIRTGEVTLVEGLFNNAVRDPDYAEAFRKHGVDVDELPVETSIDRLKARPALAIVLAAALDDWVFVRRSVQDADVPRWNRLVAVARGIDPEPLRDRVRAAWGQPLASVRDDLRRLADSIDVRVQHPATLAILARTLRNVQHTDSALRILQEAQHVHPGDSWLNSELGKVLTALNDHEGAVRFCTAAVASQPRSAGAAIISAMPCATRRSWTRPSPATARPSSLAPNTPSHTTTWVSPSTKRGASKGPSPSTAERSSSTRNSPTPTAISASPCESRRSCPRPSTLTTRPSSSARIMPAHTTTSATPCATRRSCPRPSTLTTRPSSSPRNSPCLTTTSATRCVIKTSCARVSPATARPSSSTRNSPWLTATSRAPCATRRNCQRPSTLITRPSSSTRNPPATT